MGGLEESHHIRVAGVAPAIVRTPLWLNHNDKKNWIGTDGQEQDDWVYPEEVAEVVRSKKHLSWPHLADIDPDVQVMYRERDE